MKKIYKVTTYTTDGCEGKNVYTETEYVKAENIDKYIEVKKAEIENTKYWWMDHATDKDGRPWIEAEAIEIKEV